MSKKAKKPTSFAIINGRKVSADTGRSLDGFARNAPSSVAKAKQPAREKNHHLDLSAANKAGAPAPRKQPAAPVAGSRGLDGLGTAGRAQANAARATKRRTPAATQVHARHSAQASRAAHAQRTAAQRQAARKKAQRNSQPSVAKKQIKPRHEVQVDHGKHPVPQSARLTEARHRRAHMYRQASAISKFGRYQRTFEPAQAEPKEAPATKDHDDSPVDLHAMIESLRQPVAHINHEIAQHHQRHSQHARDTEKKEDKEPLFKRVFQSQKFIASTATVMSMALIVGYIAYLNAPNIAMRVAASRAGFEASLPGNVPSGFALDGPIRYSDGMVVMNFGSNSDERAFKLAQKESNWDSASLRSNLASTRNSQINEYSEGGLTIFIYDGSNASWVDGGIRYDIEGSSLLSAEQIASIAESL